jgi:hypothetical protein
MPDFVKNLGDPRSPFGVNNYLRSVYGLKTESYTVAKDSVPYAAGRNDGPIRILQRGTVMAKITSGPDIGKIGPFQSGAGATAEVQTITPSGTWTGTTGTYTITSGTESIEVPVGSTGVQVAALVDAMKAFAEFAVTGAGGPLGTGVITLTFTGDNVDADVPQLVFSKPNVVGGTSPNATVATTTQGAPGAVDGRQTPANIVGICETFVPWQLNERDVEVSIVYEASVVQGWCIELDAAGNQLPLSNATAAYMQRGGAAGKSVDITFN